MNVYVFMYIYTYLPLFIERLLHQYKDIKTSYDYTKTAENEEDIIHGID